MSHSREELSKDKAFIDIGIQKLVDTNILQQVQEKIAKVTMLSMITVNNKGEPITKETSFSEFCRTRRESTSCKQICYFSDAYGALKGAMSNSPYIYRCPAGLVDCAIPIIINNQHVGAVLMGQVRCSDQDCLEKLEDIVKEDTAWRKIPHLVEKYERTPIIEFEKIKSTADLVFFIINQMIEREVALLIQNEFLRKEKELLEERKVNFELKKKLEEAELYKLKHNVKPQFILNVLNSISNLSLLEEAEQTNEMANLFAEILRFNMEHTDNIVFLEQEINNIECYLKFQKIRFGAKLDYELIINTPIDQQKIDALLLLPIVENSVVYGILAKETAGFIRLTVDADKDHIEIIIEDNGIGLAPKEIDHVYKQYQLIYEIKQQGVRAENSQTLHSEKLGLDYEIQLSSEENVGTTVVVKIPK
ncbi:MAG: PocR ligand-binding domain-containing protein [Anaerobacillus sp.]|uniref:PocR ligand-binding domain-containing protein n=1 Tax=Anaerobacillus sp. TaxID=1872506 RepID=UPI00391DCF2E